MAHRVSAAALRAARQLAREYRLEPRPEDEVKTGRVAGITGKEAHVAIVIDYATKVYTIALLRPELFYWQKRLRQKQVDAPQLAGFLKRFLETFAEVPQYRPDESRVYAEWERLAGFGPEVPNVLPLTKCALEALRFLLHYYRFLPHDEHEFLVELDGVRVAQLVELGLGMDRALDAVPLAQLYLERLKNGQATEKELRACFKQLGIFLAFLPNFEDRREETMLLT